MARPLITGRHSNIAIAAYAVERARVESLLPDGVEIDPAPPELCTAAGTDGGAEGGADGESVGGGECAIVSLVGFSGTEMRMWGIAWPGQSRYTEIALRVHVRQAASPDRRGVVHIKRYVSRKLFAWAGAKYFGERCEQQGVEEETRQLTRSIEANYRIKYTPPMLVPGPGQLARPAGTPGEWSFTVQASKPSVRPDARGHEHWLKEARWVLTGSLSGPGTGAAGAPDSPERGGTMIHEILHPTWSLYPVMGIGVDMDFANLFGADWGFLTEQRPVVGVLAVGSEVAIFGRRPTVQVLWGERRMGVGAGGEARRRGTGPGSGRG
jgi:hypothetical protein